MDRDIENNLKRIAKGAGISIVGLVFAKAFNYIYRFIISRAGPEAYGMFSLASAIVGFMTLVALLGLTSGAMRYVALYSAKKQWNNVTGSILSSLRIVGVSSILVVLLIFLSAGYIADTYHMPGLALALQIFAISIPFDSLTQVLYSTLLGFKRIRYYTYSLQIVSPSVKVVSVLLLMFFGYGLYAMIGSTVLSAIITFFVALYFLEVKVHPFLKKWKNFVSFESELLKYSVPLGFSGFIYLLMSWTDTLFLGYFRDAASVGIYNVAVPTAQLLYLIPSAFSALFAPLLTEAYGIGNKKGMQTMYKAVIRWNIYFNIPLLFIIVLFSPSIISVFFGADYVSGYMATGILSFAVITNSITVPAIWVLITIGKTRDLMNITVISYVSNLVLNILLIPGFGLEGAAIATLISSLLLCILSIWLVRKYAGLAPFSANIVNSIISALLSISALYFISNYIMSRSVIVLAAFFAIYCIIYTGILLLLGTLDEEDKSLLEKLKKKIIP